MIISGGLNIYPIEIEGLIDEVDGVVESAVIGVPHKDFGEAVVAVIATKDAGLTAEKITAHIGDKLARFKQPKQIFFVETLPRNTMGKVQKATLRKTHEGLFV
jgi:malonyl-CoA/methylmalonyl-CoA synthetase